MSAHALKAEVRVRIAAYIAELTEDLINRHTDPPAQINMLQGKIQGLREAVMMIDKAYNEFGG